MKDEMIPDIITAIQTQFAHGKTVIGPCLFLITKDGNVSPHPVLSHEDPRLAALMVVAATTEVDELLFVSQAEALLGKIEGIDFSTPEEVRDYAAQHGHNVKSAIVFDHVNVNNSPDKMERVGLSYFPHGEDGKPGEIEPVHWVDPKFIDTPGRVDWLPYITLRLIMKSAKEVQTSKRKRGSNAKSRRS